ncbi:hypothetical protein ACLIMP_04035 [Novosphingobium aerophilum]|uniref:hypothetical protein n=1 Tax=Novosphingobium TaxID=165696 RepID=UPI000B2ADEAB|nr:MULTISPECIES: hypothetical protein [unclassified Novosphingobium]TCM37691.1 hypothetical protein EDF59_11087 [Novosphingobium sp. ST904]WRT93441.1 hypothetical protein U9J33_02720 [Novosphingobium sp. RL4]
MTLSNTSSASRPLAVVLAAVLMAAFWLPTVSTPAEAAATAGNDVIVLAAPITPALM